MPDGQVLEFTRVTKRFNDVTAVSDFSARVEPGVVTAFLGPNGAGKTTTLRILLGQVRATSGTATIGGVAYPELRHPLRTIGSVLEETVYRPRRSAARQLTIAAKANGIPLSRVDEVLSLVGLEHESEGRIGSFSLGMRQRLSVAHALLGDPGALVFDEPANGLDPEGIRWMRLLMRRLADEGRTVLVSSHVLSEVEQVADHVLVLSKGHLVLSSGIEKLADPSGGAVIVDAADRAALTTALSTAGLEVEVLRSGLTVRGSNAGTVGAIAASAGIALSTLVQRGPTLEDVFIDLVRGGRFEPRAVAAASAPIAMDEADASTDSSDLAAVAAVPLSSADADGAGDATGASDGAGTAGAEDVEADADAQPHAEDARADAAAAAAASEAADVQADADADAAAAADDVEYAAAELGYAAAASDANDAEDAADVVSEAADTHVDEEPAEDSDASDSSSAEASPSFDEILFGAPVASSDVDADAGAGAGAGADSPLDVDAESGLSENESVDDIAAADDSVDAESVDGESVDAESVDAESVD
ncbi:ATP-binding cassette domain-containing protein, partial [Microbacterium sp. ISL-103]|uniref:ATP-binding cassette domain-containing protein n=1 Tax=Microbacterium sp. ISL-103 TaxID=2819156 RepID=UPI001BE761A6